VLGPVLFNLYVGSVMNDLKSCNYLGYADDSYVTNYGTDIGKALEVTRNNIITHTDKLTQIGMVVNQSKTEIMIMSHSGKTEERMVDINDEITLQSVTKLKALGVILDAKLKWDSHIAQLRKRITRVLNGLKIIRRKLNFKQAITIVTTQALSILYYASSAWVTPSIGRKEMNALESIHFKALRVVVNDYRQRMSRDVISALTNRLPPRIWCKLACAMTLMKIWNTGVPAGIRQTAFANIYQKKQISRYAVRL